MAKPGDSLRGLWLSLCVNGSTTRIGEKLSLSDMYINKIYIQYSIYDYIYIHDMYISNVFTFTSMYVIVSYMDSLRLCVFLTFELDSKILLR